MSKNSFSVFFLGAVGMILASWFWAPLGSYVLLEKTSAATSSAVTVSASVGAVISCSSNVGSTDFGAMTSGGIATATPNASTTMSCSNSASGCTLSVKDAGGGGNPGLWNSANSYLIPSPNAAYNPTSTLAAGTEGYGIQATTTVTGSGFSPWYCDTLLADR